MTAAGFMTVSMDDDFTEEEAAADDDNDECEVLPSKIGPTKLASLWQPEITRVQS